MKYFLSMAALALVGAMTVSCSSDDNIIDQPQQPETKNNVVTLTTTVGLDGGAGTTRALTSTGVKTFAEGEKMALRYKNKKGDWVKAESNALEAKDIADGSKSATFTFTLDNPDKTKTVEYIYPAAIVNELGNMDEAALFGSQDGTLNTIASTFDYSRKGGAWDGENLPSLTLENQLAILAITLKDEAGANDITSSITGLTLSEGTKTYNVNRSAVAGPIYVAIYPTTSATIDITATSGTKNYTKTLTGKTYAKGNGYPVSWRMAEAGPTAYTLAESTVGMIVGSDGNAYAVADKDNLPTGVTAVAMVAYKSGSNGLAIQLNDTPEEKEWDEAKTYAAGLDAVTGGTWRLPSKDDWQNMFVGCAVAGDASAGDNMNPIAGFKAKIAATGISWWSGTYWSSTESGSDAWDVNVYLDGDAYAEFYEGATSVENYVLGCLAF